MFEKAYSVVDQSLWDGRIDSESDYDSFRWHQWIKFLDLANENLEAYQGKLGFAFLGFECDMGVNLNKGRTGAAKGPRSIRKELANFPCQFPKEVALFDAGNISCEGLDLDQAQDALAQAVSKILSLNLFPILLGGGHEIAFGHYKGILDHVMNNEDKQNIGIVNFDAHFDLRPYPKGGTSGTMFRQIADLSEENDLDFSYFCVGIQKHANTVNLFDTADKLGVEYIFAKDMINMDSYAMIERLDDFLQEQDHIYVTLCSDVFSSAFAPGVSAPQALGLDPENVLILLKYLLRSKKTISFDIAEVSPRFDLDNTTANLASVFIFTVVHTLSKLI